MKSIFVIYILVLLAVGWLAERTAKGTQGVKGFLLGDREMGPWATALSYEATAYSGWLMLGLPGRAFGRGLAAVWIAVTNVVGDALNWVGVARRLREETSRLGALTVPEYLERRFAKPGGTAVRVVASTAIVTFMLIYLWAQCVAAGKTMTTILGVNYQLATVISAAVIMIYTFQGGYRAVVWTDCVQATMVIVALVALPLACLYQLGGFGGLAGALREAASDATAGTMPGPRLTDWFAGLSGLALFTMLFEDAGVGLGYLGQPHTCARFMAVRSAEYLRASFIISIIWAALVCTGAVTVGLVAHGWFRADAAGVGSAVKVGPTSDRRLPLADPEEALPRLAIAVFPEWLAGFVVSAIMAPIMSSSAGFLLSAASSISKDIYPHLLRRRSPGDRELVLVARAATLLIGTLALALALATDPLDKRSAVYSLVLYAWGGLSGCFSATVLMALYYREMTRAGCLAGMIVGSSTIVVWHNIPALAGIAYELIPSFVFSIASIVIVSRLTRRPTVLGDAAENRLWPGR